MRVADASDRTLTDAARATPSHTIVPALYGSFTFSPHYRSAPTRASCAYTRARARGAFVSRRLRLSRASARFSREAPPITSPFLARALTHVRAGAREPVTCVWYTSVCVNGGGTEFSMEREVRSRERSSAPLGARLRVYETQVLTIAARLANATR